MKLKRENIQQWFSLEEAVKFIFEDDDASVKNLIEFIENNQLSVYLKKYTHTQHSVDTKKDLIRYLILSLDSLISYSNSKIKIDRFKDVDKNRPIGFELVVPSGVYEIINFSAVRYIRISLGVIKIDNPPISVRYFPSDGYWMYNLGYLDDLITDGEEITLSYLESEELEEMRVALYGQERVTFEYEFDSLEDLNEYAEIGITREELERFKQTQSEPTSQPQDKPQRATPISDQHRENLLRQIRANGYNALELPMWKAGKPSIKSEMRELLVPDTMTADVFKKTWERASNDKIIQYKK